MPDEPVRPVSSIYQTLGGYYDQLVGDLQAVEDWVKWIESFHPGLRFLELACGSGEITRSLAKSHAVEAMDLSQAMLDQACAKDGAQTIRFHQGDMRDLSGYGQYDAIGCFCDSFNYLTEEDEVRSLFEQAADHLSPGGLLLFDTHGMARLDEFADDYEEAGTFEDGTQVQWIISAQDGYLYQDFAFYFPRQTIQEHHLQRVWDPDWLKQQLESRFEILSVSGDFGRAPLDEAEKVFFACRKKG